MKIFMNNKSCFASSWTILKNKNSQKDYLKRKTTQFLFLLWNFLDAALVKKLILIQKYLNSIPSEINFTKLCASAK